MAEPHLALCTLLVVEGSSLQRCIRLIHENVYRNTHSRTAPVLRSRLVMLQLVTLLDKHQILRLWSPFKAMQPNEAALSCVTDSHMRIIHLNKSSSICNGKSAL